jgi:hypothetical protein
VTFTAYTSHGTAGAGDYIGKALVGQVIPAGQLAATFAVSINGDTVVEKDDTLLVNLGYAKGAAIADGQGVGTIRNDDGPLLSIGDVGYFEGDTGNPVVGFKVSLSQPAPVPVTFDFATLNGTAKLGSDFHGRTATGQVIPAGQLSTTVAVATIADTAVEPNEAWYGKITAASVTVLDAQGVATVVNDDGPTLSVSDASVVEGDGVTSTLEFTVRLSQAATVPVSYRITTLNGSASAPADFTAATSTRTIPAGTTTQSFQVAVQGDLADEANETMSVVLYDTTVSLVDGQGIGTIVDDD